MRKYIRHPSDIPIEYKPGRTASNNKSLLNNISKGGLSFMADTCLEPGTPVAIRIPIRKPAFREIGVVVWCRKKNGEYEVGVMFRDEATEFRLRMVEQICHIEHYKAEVMEREGRRLTGAEAASEWIKRYAGNFPS